MNSPATKSEKLLAGLFLALLAAASVILFLFDPAHHAFYPQCPLHRLTGLECPLCGTLRALHQLLLGNFAAAWKLNALTVTLLPLGAWLAAREIARIYFNQNWPNPLHRPRVNWALAALALSFGILRNLPDWHP